MSKREKNQSEKEYLANYDASEFASPLITVDLCIFTVIENRLHLLTVKREQHPEQGKTALPGGFVDMGLDSDLEETALRKLFEKTGVKSPYLEQVESIGNKHRDPRGWSVTTLFFALIPYVEVEQANYQGDEITWLPFEDVNVTSFAFDHKQLIEKAYQRLASKVSYSDIAFYVMPEKFTLTELQKTYELLLGQKLEKKSFRRRLLNAELVTELDEFSSERGRPAALFKRSQNKTHYFNRVLGK